jgi:hypothetical protein
MTLAAIYPGLYVTILLGYSSYDLNTVNGQEDKQLSDYYDITLTMLFDVLIFLKETTQTTALFKVISFIWNVYTQIQHPATTSKTHNGCCRYAF